ncbi:hypothetical protein, partial [Ralstonia solanacearum]|uniref:hypothetical protein n=1 Tax=Ralstonia solanacearum TaxID=305 RepID=UPI001E3848C4
SGRGIGGDTQITDGNVAGWRDRKPKIDDGGGGGIREGRPLTASEVTQPSSGGHRTAQRARPDAGAAASAQRRVTNNPSSAAM